MFVLFFFVFPWGRAGELMLLWVFFVDCVCDETSWAAACGCVLDCALAEVVGVDSAEYEVVV